MEEHATFMYLDVQSTDLLELHNILHAFSCYALYTKYEIQSKCKVHWIWL